MKKAFFFDIDGTLVHKVKDKLVVSDKNLKAIKELRKQGYKTFIATGRTHSFVPQEVLELPMDGFITANGSVVEIAGEVIYEKLFPQNAIKHVLEFCKKHDHNWLFEGKLAYTDNLESKPLVSFYNNVVVNKDKMFEVSYDELKGRIVYNALILGIDIDVVGLQHKLGDGFVTAPHPEHGYVDCYLEGNTKADGIDKAVKHLGLEDCETYAFGDGNNDLEMFDRVDVAVAMENATDELKEKASFITKANYHDGVYHALVKLDLVKS
jgi:Cof subfamily protein (haloacid dehalogenase superfamily)